MISCTHAYNWSCVHTKELLAVKLSGLWVKKKEIQEGLEPAPKKRVQENPITIKLKIEPFLMTAIFRLILSYPIKLISYS